MYFKHPSNCTVELDVYKSQCRQIAGNKSSLLLVTSLKGYRLLSVAPRCTSLAVTIRDGCVLVGLWIAFFSLVWHSPVSQSSTGQGEVVGVRAEGLAQEGVPEEEVAGSQMG